MNKEKFENKINKKYGITTEELAQTNVKEAKIIKEKHKIASKKKKENIKNLKVSDNIKNNKIGKYILKTFGGASTGIAIAEGINFCFPTLIPNIAAFYAGTQYDKLSLLEKGAILLGLSSKPTFHISHLAIIGVGALVGILGHTGYTLTKNGINHISVKNDIKQSQKLHK